MKPFARTVLAVLAGGLIAILAIVALALFTDSGRRLAARTGFWALERFGGYRVSCGEFSGSLFSSFTCQDFAVADAEGVFLTGRELQLAWRFAPVIRGLVAVERLHVADAVMTRPPVSEPDAQPFELPQWPAVDIAVDAFALEQFQLRFPDRPPICFGGAGGLMVAEPVLSVSTRMTRCNGEGQLSLTADYREEELMLDAAAADDGRLAEFLFGWAGAGTTQLRVSGGGPLEDMQLALEASVENAAAAMLRVNTRPLGPGGEIGASVAGAISLAEGRAPSWAPAESGEISATATATLEGAFSTQGMLRWGGSDIRFSLALPEGGGALRGEVGASLGQFGDGVGFASGEIEAAFAGTRAAPAATVSYVLQSFQAPGIAAEELRGQATLSLLRDGRVMAFSTEATALDPAIAEFIDAALGQRTAISAEGSYTFAEQGLELDLEVGGEQARLVADADIAFAPALSGSASLQLALEEGVQLAGVRIPGGAILEAELRDIGPSGRADATVQLESRVLAARGAFSRAANGTISGRFASERIDPAFLSEITGFRFTGEPSLVATASGATAAPDLRVAFEVPRVARGDLVVSDMQGEAAIALRDARWRTVADLTGTTNAGPLSASVTAAWGGTEPIRVGITEGALLGATLEGALTAAEWSGPWSGMVAVRGRPLAPVAAWTNAQIAGTGEILVDFEARDGRQAVDAVLDLSNVQYGQVLTNATVEGRLAYMSDGPVEAQLAVMDGEDRLRLAADGSLGQANVITVRTFAGEWDEVPFQLLAPARVEISGADDIVLPGAALQVAEGRVELAGAKRGDALSLQTSLAQLPMSTVAAMLGWPNEVEGRIGGTALISFAPGSAQARLTLAANDIAFAREQRGVEPADLNLNAIWNGQTVTVQGTMTGIGTAPAQLSATLPLVRVPGEYSVQLPEHGNVSGRFDGSVRAERLMALLPLPEHRLSGLFRVNLGVTGDIAAPDISGSAALQDGIYESLELGTQLRDLDIAFTATPEGALLLTGRATDGGAGTFALSGRAALMQGFATVNAELRTTNADLVRTDDYTVRGSSMLTFVRGTEGPARVSGTVTTTEVRFDLASPLPQGIREIEVIEINRPPELGVVVAPDRSPEFVRTMQLDIDVNMPNRVFVTGYGLDAEWGGDLDIGGTAGDPVISGQFTLIRGQAEFLGRDFELETGTIAVDPAAPGDARLRVIGVHEQPGLTVRVTAEGTAADPEVSWSSTPALPRDEILSRLYFGRTSPSLSAVEAVQLAQLSGIVGGVGGAGGVLGFARQLTGLDVLRFEGGLAGADGGPRVTVGEYVSDRVFVGAATGTDTSSATVQVEVQITPEIAVEVEAGAAGNNAVGVLWEKDY